MKSCEFIDYLHKRYRLLTNGGVTNFPIWQPTTVALIRSEKLRNTGEGTVYFLILQ